MSNKCFLLKFVPFKILYVTVRQATYDKTAHALCVLDNQVNRHKLRMCNIAFPLQHLYHERA